jgi:hypothetical protein
MSALTPTPEATPVAPAAPIKPSKAKIAAHAFVKAVISPQAKKLEFSLIRYVAYAVAAALGYKHANTLGF